MPIYRCRDCEEVVTDAAGHICPKKFGKVENPAEICAKNGHRFEISYWTDQSGPGERVDTWENDEGHHEAYEHKKMEHKKCVLCGYAEDKCVGKYPNPRFK